MDEFPVLTLPALLKATVERHALRPAVSFVDGEPITYANFSKKVKNISAFLRRLDIKTGDRVAILSVNMPHWGIAYFAIVSMGAIVVPLLPDLSQEEIKNILRHAHVSTIFVSQNLMSKLTSLNVHALKYKIHIEDFTLFEGMQEVAFHLSTLLDKEYLVEEDDIAAIIYTSGTTGRSKGVMLSNKNISFNAIKGGTLQKLTDRDRFLSVLPLPHVYENTIGFILPLLVGACVYYLRKPPSPSVLIPALQKVKPTMMLTVPLIIEKIYRTKVLPAFTEKKWIKKLYQKPFFRKILNQMAGKKLLKLFGGELIFFGIGGAKINKQVEQFLLEAKFPYGVGYGLTETAPLLAGFGPKEARSQSAGKILEGVEVIIHNPDAKTGEGEIWARGPNVMKGYYKEPELTSQVLTEDGWFKTGDLGIFDKDNYLFIRGRLKNVIIGPEGENIYPEEIESVINNFKNVVESLVIEHKGKLVALVHMDWDSLNEKYQEIKGDISDFIDYKSKGLSKEIQDYINQRVSRFASIQKVILHKDEFVKTATKKIKRFLYKEENNYDEEI